MPTKNRRFIWIFFLIVSLAEANSPQLENHLQNLFLNRFPRQVEEECSSNETVNSEGGTLTSPGYPTRYPSNSDCRWLLTSPDDTSIILRIKSLHLEKGTECDLDYLQIHLGSTTLSPSLDRICGTVSDKVINTNSSTVLLIFHSDPSYEDKGFSIDYYLQSSSGCPSTVRDSSGVITSPGFPDNYPDNSDCWTLISVAKDKSIIFEFDTIDLEYDENCTYDFVEIFDGASRDSLLLGRFCTNDQKVPIQSTTNELLVHFRSDHLVTKKGFKGHHSTISSANSININDLGGCLWESELHQGVIASPNYPQKYPSNSECKVLLQAPPGHVILLSIDALQLEAEVNCSYDYLELRNGQNIGGDETDVTRFCGRKNESTQFTSLSNKLILIFHSDDFAEFSGFKLKYRFSDNINATFVNIDETSSNKNEGPMNKSEDIFIKKPENATLEFGESYMLDCIVSDPVAKIRWLKDDQFLGGNTPLPGIKLIANNSLWIQSANKQVTGIYTCAAVTPEKTHLAIALLKLDNDPDVNDTSCSIVFRKSPRDSTFTEGEFAHLECLTAGNQVQVHWEKDGFPLQNRNHITILKNGFLFIDKITLEDQGTYTCVSTDLVADCQKSISVKLTVNGKAKLQEICGIPKVGQPSTTKPRMDHGKIVGGHNTKKGAYPWQVMLWEPQLKSFCGGTLLNERWIITAAHCLTSYEGLRWTDIVIKFGKYDRESQEPEEVSTMIAETSAVVIHPAYNKNVYDNDIALIRLRDHITFTDYILPICLGSWEFFENEENLKMGTVTGWGKLKTNGALPKYLQEIQMPLVPQKACIESTEYLVTRNMFCAGYAQEIVGDACNGDSGGPFITKQENRWYLVGIVSWGEGCGQANKYGFYTRVTNYLPWIRGIMKS